MRAYPLHAEGRHWPQRWLQTCVEHVSHDLRNITGSNSPAIVALRYISRKHLSSAVSAAIRLAVTAIYATRSKHVRSGTPDRRIAPTNAADDSIASIGEISGKTAPDSWNGVDASEEHKDVDIQQRTLSLRIYSS